MLEAARRGLKHIVRYIFTPTQAVTNVELPEGEALCSSCLGAGGWATDFEGGWFSCPSCGGKGTVPARAR